MKRTYKKSILKREQPIRFEVTPSQIDLGGIYMPKITYHLVGSVESEKVFTGDVLPIPTVLINFLPHSQFIVLSCIMDECMKHGCCRLKVIDMAKRLNSNQNTVAIAIVRLKAVSLLKERRMGRQEGTERRINYEGIQHLYDLVQGEDPGVYVRIRNACGLRKDLMQLTKEDIKKAYDNKILPPEHDPEEEEEYD